MASFINKAKDMAGLTPENYQQTDTTTTRTENQPQQSGFNENIFQENNSTGTGAGYSHHNDGLNQSHTTRTGAAHQNDGLHQTPDTRTGFGHNEGLNQTHTPGTGPLNQNDGLQQTHNTSTGHIRHNDGLNQTHTSGTGLGHQTHTPGTGPLNQNDGLQQTHTTKTGPVHHNEMLNKADPRVHEHNTTHFGTGTGVDPTDAAQVPPSVMKRHVGEPTIEHDQPELSSQNKASRDSVSHQEAHFLR